MMVGYKVFVFGHPFFVWGVSREHVRRTVKVHYAALAGARRIGA